MLQLDIQENYIVSIHLRCFLVEIPSQAERI